jgi:alginate O-acetyltransferase complex protein AlgI
MLFNSFEFMAFMALALILFYATRIYKVRRILLIVASYIFYGAWNPPYLLLLAGTTLLDFSVAKRMDRVNSAAARRFLLISSITFNLVLLGSFKYGEFLVGNLNLVLSGLGLPGFEYRPGGIILPLGLSFYTFQSIGYVVDVYRRHIKAETNILDYALFVSFFPQLVAGPILRAAEFIPQIKTLAQHRIVGLEQAAFLLVLGLFQKTVMADNIAPLVDAVFKAPASYGSADVALAVYGFAFQIYFDFAGYSNMAIGLAMLFGFRIPENFNNPYAAIGLRDFWTRWHISLSQWLRDYLYISLGGNRTGSGRTARNLMITMLLGGLWHGASWTFVLWGGIHGLYLIAERRLVALAERLGLRRPLGPAARLVAIILTFHAVCFAWIFFRAQNGLDQAFLVLHRLVVPTGTSVSPLLQDRAIYVYLGGLYLAVLWSFHALRLRAIEAAWLRGLLAGGMLALAVLGAGAGNAFIYFQF